MPHSHHSHSGQFCRHATQGTTLEQSVQEAIKQGFRTFGLSEHCPRYRDEDKYPEESDLTCGDLKSTFLTYLDEAHRLKALYRDQIDLLVGLETDFITTLDLDNLETLIQEQGDRIEYLVGGVHHVNTIPIDFDTPTYLRAVSSATSSSSSTSSDNLGPYLLAYFAAQHTLLSRVQPQVIAHLDLCRLYTPELDLKDEQRYPGVWQAVERNVDLIVGYGGLVELSSASLRKGWEGGYPGGEVLDLLIEKGARLCLSDDSHGPSFVGLNYGRLKTYLLKHEVAELWYLATPNDGEVPPAVGRGRLMVKKVMGRWWEDAFWTDR